MCLRCGFASEPVPAEYRMVRSPFPGMFTDVPNPKSSHPLHSPIRVSTGRGWRCLLLHRRLSRSWSHLSESLPWLAVQLYSCRQHPHPRGQANKLESAEPSLPVCPSVSLPTHFPLRCGQGATVLCFCKEASTHDLNQLTFFRVTNSFSAAVRLLISSSYLELERTRHN